MSARTIILSNIRAALTGVPSATEGDLRGSAASSGPDVATLIERFSRELARIDGEVYRAKNASECTDTLARLLSSANCRNIMIADGQPNGQPHLGDQLRKLLPADVNIEKCGGQTISRIPSMDTGILFASGLIAETGTVILIPSTHQPRALALLPELMVIIASISQCDFDMDSVLSRFRDEGVFGKTSSLLFMTGSSRTSDIEKTLVKGVHGPKRLVVVLVGA